LLGTDGSPTWLYKQFRNPSTSKSSMAEAIKMAYAELYSRNEYSHDFNKKDFAGLVVEATGDSAESKKVQLIVSTFFNVKDYAAFEKKLIKRMKKMRSQKYKKTNLILIINY